MFVCCHGFSKCVINVYVYLCIHGNVGIHGYLGCRGFICLSGALILHLPHTFNQTFYNLL